MNSKPTPEGRYTVSLSGESLGYELLRSARRSLGITVTPAAELKVTAPVDADRSTVERIMQRRGDWIRRQLRETAALPPAPPAKEWVSGETHLYLGRQYRLSLRVSHAEGVKLIGRYFQIGLESAPDPKSVERLMMKWYRNHARVTFARRMAQLVASTPRLGLQKPPPLLVRTMRTRWGSCSPSGRILMNVEAVKLPTACIDYVLMHELCHLRHATHSRAFWYHLDCCMPDWERLRLRLGRAEI